MNATPTPPHSGPATATIHAAISADGPIRFDRFMELALYGDGGFYTGPADGAAGRRGDFITSPETGPLFGVLVGRWIDERWRAAGSPDEFTVVDVGAGPGTLARSVRAAQPACAPALRYVAVERSAGQRQRHPDDIESRETLPDALDGAGVAIANELFDNVPFRLAVFDGGWREAHVGVASDGRFVEVLGEALGDVPGDALDGASQPGFALPATAPHGARIPIVTGARALLNELRELTGSVLVFDYGVGHTAELAGRPWRDWLRTFRSNERGDHYLTAPGSQDITADVPFDQLPEPDWLRTQSQFLQLLGIDELVEEGKRVWAEQAARPGLEAMRMRSRVSEAEALLDQHGLGGFFVAHFS